MGSLIIAFGVMLPKFDKDGRRVPLTPTESRMLMIQVFIFAVGGVALLSWWGFALARVGKWL